MRPRGHTLVPQLSLIALILIGCSPKKEAATRPDSTATAPAPATPNVVTVHAKDFAFDAPDSIPSGMTTFKLVNDGPSFHHMQILRLDSSMTVANLQEGLKKPGPLPGWVEFAGGPDAPDPGAEANATLDMAPGNYVLACFVDVPGGVPHLMKGMIHGLTVTKSATASAPAPHADITITLADYSFTLSTPLTAGSHTIEVQNDATQPHELEIIRLPPGKTAKDFMKWVKKPNGPPPASGLGGTAATVQGLPVYFSVDLTPGTYVLMCFLPDPKDGKAHYEHGMVQTVVVS